MGTSIGIRSFADSEWVEYKAIRLKALAESPDAFGSTHEREARLTDEDWAERLSDGVASELKMPLVAMDGSLAVGLVWAIMSDGARPVVTLYQMWVEPRSRGQGIGASLLSAAIDWAQSKRAEMVTLEATCGETAANRLYVQRGFRPIGEPGRLRDDSNLLDQRLTLLLG